MQVQEKEEDKEKGANLKQVCSADRIEVGKARLLLIILFLLHLH